MQPSQCLISSTLPLVWKNRCGAVGDLPNHLLPLQQLLCQLSAGCLSAVTVDLSPSIYLCQPFFVISQPALHSQSSVADTQVFSHQSGVCILSSEALTVTYRETLWQRNIVLQWLVQIIWSLTCNQVTLKMFIIETVGGAPDICLHTDTQIA